MTVEAVGMMSAGSAALVTGLIFGRERFTAASGAGRVLVLGPVCEATALAMFAAEHFTAAHELMGVVPKWLPGHLFWTYLVGAALLAAAISFITWRQVRWSASMLALFFLIIVATLDLANISGQMHDRFFWILTVRETSFASGAMVLAGSVWPRESWASAALVRVGRSVVALVMIFYATQHFLFPRHVPGVPLEKLIPGWVPAPVVLSWAVGVALLAGGIGLLIRPAVRMAAAGAGIVLVLLTIFFYVPILATEIHSALVIEGLNYVGDTLLFAATVLLAGLGADQRVRVSAPKREETAARPCGI
ncbi:MAG TPA: hypothetical protein VGR47_00295 [Terracidiphilus sp.]|nr:hypothetical protein [Terracidiphilus sp.]